MHVLRGMCKLE